MNQAKLTEPLSVTEVSIFLGTGWKAAKAWCKEVDGIECSSGWQLPLDRMPPSYFQTRVSLSLPQSPPVVTLPESASTNEHGEYNCSMETLLNERDTAIRLRISIGDLNALIEAEQMPFIPVGVVHPTEIRFRPSDVTEAIRKLSTKSLPARRTNECHLQDLQAEKQRPSSEINCCLKPKTPPPNSASSGSTSCDRSQSET